MSKPSSEIRVVKWSNSLNAILGQSEEEQMLPSNEFGDFDSGGIGTNYR